MIPAKAEPSAVDKKTESGYNNKCGANVRFITNRVTIRV